LNQDYPVDSLEVIVIDDCSTDKSLEVVKATIAELCEKEARYKVAERLSYFKQPQNAGKREAMAVGAKLAKHDLLVFVDSDSFLNPYAIINLVQPFKDKDMGGVSGRTDVANTYTNGLTKMQAVRYYISFRVMKAAEAYFDAVTCLSGPLACYRKDLVMENMDAWLNQTFLGQRATFGDDRSMTNFILRNHRTNYQDTAICSTIVPNSYEVFLKQQMRWKRSWLRESINAGKFMWKKEPFMSICFYIGVLVPIIAPVIVLYNLVYVPFVYRVFPTTFILGMLLMALMMSLAQKILRKSSTWLYGLWFCLYYEAVLLWQMPIAWVTFWKANWGTRPTPADVEEEEKKKEKEKQKLENKKK
jgi:hyaluronan synthase